MLNVRSSLGVARLFSQALGGLGVGYHAGQAPMKMKRSHVDSPKV